MSLPQLSIHRPVFVTVLLVLLILLGALSYTRMNVDEMPDVSLPYVSISVTWEGAQPEQVDAQLVQRIEEAVAEAKGVKHIESTARVDGADVNVEFVFGTDPAAAAQEIRDKVSAVRGEFPDGVKEPVISRFDMKAAPVAAFAITSERASMRELTIFAEDTIKPRLQKIPGLGKLRIAGKEEREIQLRLRLDDLNAVGLSLTEVERRLREANQDIPAGTMQTGGAATALRTDAKARTVDDFLPLSVGVRGGTVVPFGDIGTAVDTVKEPEDIARYDGKPALIIEVGKQSGANAVQVAAAVKEEVARIEAQLPEGMEIHLVRDDAARVEASIEEVWFDLALGSIAAVLIVWWFLGDWRSTLISALAIPASIVATFFFMNAAGFSINTMSLLGLSLSVGLLIDDAIVVIENIIRHRQMGKGSLEAALQGTQEIALAVLATTLTIVAVFLPVGMMSGAEGEFFKEFGLSVAFAVLVSLFISFTMTPMIAALYLPVGEPRMPAFLTGAWQRFDAAFHAGAAWYAAHLGSILKYHRKKTVLAALALFFLSLCLTPLMGSSYLPVTDQGQFTLRVKNPAGTSIAGAEQRMEQLTAALTDIPEIRHVYATATKTEQALFIVLAPKAERTRSQNEIISAARRTVNEIPGMRADIEQGDGKPVAISLTGASTEQLAVLARETERRMEEVPGVRDVSRSGGAGAPTLRVAVDTERADDLGVSAERVGKTLQTLFFGTVVGKFSDAEEQRDIRLLLTPEERNRTDVLGSVYVESEKQQHTLLPLAQMTHTDYVAEAGEVRRFDRQKEVRLTANLEGTNLGAFSEAFFAEDALPQLPVGYQIGATGESDDMDSSFQSMMTALALAVILIFMVMAAQFESWTEPLAIMPTLPLAAIGALAALFLTKTDISLISLIGIMMLMGLVTKNAILLVDFAKLRMQAGLSVDAALTEAASVRLRPILMTSLAMIGGMLPIALGVGPGAEARAPMAYAIIGGVLTSTVLTLVVVPVCYSLLVGRRKICKHKNIP